LSILVCRGAVAQYPSLFKNGERTFTIAGAVSLSRFFFAKLKHKCRLFKVLICSFQIGRT
jgi:hypothetical protein